MNCEDVILRQKAVCMGCDNCSSKGENGLPGGCRNNGNCGVLGCNKLEVFDWLSGIVMDGGREPFDIVEVRFKNDRKEFLRRNRDFDTYVGDVGCGSGQIRIRRWNCFLRQEKLSEC